MGLAIRHGSDDEYVWSTVYHQNEYRLPESIRGWNVLDIGGNIGAFALLCSERGASTVLSFEPDAANRELYVQNLEGCTADVTLRPEAVWGCQGHVMLRHSANPKGHACTSVVMNLSQPGVMVPVLTFAEALSFGYWDLAKIDCEGAEYALFDCQPEVVRRAERYAIEFHLASRHDECAQRMCAYGYRLDWRTDHETGTAVMHFTRIST